MKHLPIRPVAVRASAAPRLLAPLATHVVAAPANPTATAGPAHVSRTRLGLRLLGCVLAVAIAGLGYPPSAQAQQDRVIRFGHLNNPDHPVSFGVKRFAERLAEKSGGKLKVQEYPASQLGNEMQQQSALQGGV